MRIGSPRRTLAAATALFAALTLSGPQATAGSAGPAEPTAESTAMPTAVPTAVPMALRASSQQIALATPGDFTGYGFDQCVAPTQAAMDAWRKHSPFSAVGIYISGDSRGCRTQPNLSATWVSTQVAKGWRLLPIALGPQASCRSDFPRYSDDFKISPKPANNYAAALAQGTAEADKNATDAAALGIAPGSTLWYDLESFTLSDTHCRESALQFVSGWVSRIKALGYVAGFYSSASSGIKMLDDARTTRPGQFALPDRIWIARWDGAPNTSTTYIPEDGWRPGGRMKQYLGGHRETWGGVTINIDSNFIDLGAGSRSPGESKCGGVKVGFWKYPAVSATAGPAARIKALQCLLTEQKVYAGAVDGVWNDGLTAATAAWQAKRGFAASAIWSTPHWVALLAAGNGRVLKYGATGDGVYRLQRALNAAGAGKFKATGVYDARTEAAVKTYQRTRRITVSGVATSQTWKSLKKGLA